MPRTTEEPPDARRNISSSTSPLSSVPDYVFKPGDAHITTEDRMIGDPTPASNHHQGPKTDGTSPLTSMRHVSESSLGSGNDDIISWARRVFPDTFQVMTTFPDPIFLDIDGSDKLDSENSKTVSKLLLVGSYECEDHDITNNGDVYAYIADYPRESVEYVCVRGDQQFYEKVDDSELGNIEFRDPYAGVRDGRMDKSQICRLLNALIYCIFLAAGHVSLTALTKSPNKKAEEIYQNVYPGFRQKLGMALKRLVRNYGGQDFTDLTQSAPGSDNRKRNFTQAYADSSSTPMQGTQRDQSGPTTRKKRKAAVAYRRLSPDFECYNESLQDDADESSGEDDDESWEEEEYESLEEDVDDSDIESNSHSSSSSATEDFKRPTTGRPAKRIKAGSNCVLDPFDAEVLKLIQRMKRKSRAEINRELDMQYGEEIQALSSRIEDLEDGRKRIKREEQNAKSQVSAMGRQISELLNEVKKAEAKRKEEEVKRKEEEAKRKEEEAKRKEEEARRKKAESEMEDAKAEAAKWRAKWNTIYAAVQVISSKEDQNTGEPDIEVPK